MTGLDDAIGLAKDEQGLAIVATLRADSTIQSTLVNVGQLSHPADGEAVLAFVTYGRVKLRNLRARPTIAVTFRYGWRWATVEGLAEIAGPDDPQPWLDDDRLRLLLREVYVAAGGHHDSWAEYDHVMVDQRRAAVIVRPKRIYSRGAGT